MIKPCLLLALLSNGVALTLPPPPEPPPAPPPPPPRTSGPVTMFTGTSPYHNITVQDENGARTLFFDDTMESRMELKTPYAGAFEYTDYFQMVWLWNPDAKNILMLGLGGGSTQKAMAHYHPEVTMETVEIDPMVAQVAKDYFSYIIGPKQKLNLLDGRQFLVRSKDKYDAILLDAYTQGRYGASIPPHLITKEFFQIVKDHLTPNGVLAYNVITILKGYNTSDIVASVYHTLKEVFPQVYVFEARTSLNDIIYATMSKEPMDLAALKKKADALLAAKTITFPDFLTRLDNFQPKPPADYLAAPVLTDDFAPVESLTEGVPARPSSTTP
jgi:spermidine synthase